MTTNLLVPAILVIGLYLLHRTRRTPVAAKSDRQAMPGLAAPGRILNELTDGVRHFFDSLPAPADPDLDNRRQVYAHGTDFLAEQLGCQPEAARPIVHCLCHEKDKELVADDKPTDPALLEQSRYLLIQWRLEYLFPDSRQAHRTSSITFMTDGRIANRCVKETILWEQLPSEVRDARLRQGATQLAFQLYPPRSATANP